MKKLKKSIIATIVATIAITSAPAVWADGNDVDIIKKDVNLKYNYKNTREEKSKYIKNYISKSIDANTIVNIPDVNLRNRIYSVLRKQYDEPITKGELESITSLYLYNAEISNLEGIENCINLSELNLSKNQISDLSALSSLTKLRCLNLSNNQISDISVLSNLKYIKSIYLSNNKINNITSLKNLPSVSCNDEYCGGHNVDIDNNYINLDNSEMMDTISLLKSKGYDVTYINQMINTKTGWQLIDGKWYFYNKNGEIHKGWLNLDGTWYYLRNNGEMSTGWELVNGKWYYLDGSGAMVTGWKLINGTWYYMYNSGEMATNTVIDGWKIDGNGVATPIK